MTKLRVLLTENVVNSVSGVAFFLFSRFCAFFDVPSALRHRNIAPGFLSPFLVGVLSRWALVFSFFPAPFFPALSYSLLFCFFSFFVAFTSMDVFSPRITSLNSPDFQLYVRWLAPNNSTVPIRVAYLFPFIHHHQI